MHEDSWLRPFISLLVLAGALGYYLTGSMIWGYRSHYLDPGFLYWRATTGLRNFTEAELLEHDGKHSKRIYLAVNGMVFDVNAGRDRYGPAGSYGFFSGRDGARAFGTGCFRTDVTSDLRGLSKDELDAIAGWQSFFLNNPSYWHVGYVHHPEPSGDPPPPCKAEKRRAHQV